MSVAEYRKTAAEKLNGKYSEGFCVVMICLAAYLILKIADIFKTVVIIFETNTAFSLFKTDNIGGFAIKLTGGVLTLAVMSPLITGGIWWFYQTVYDKDNKNIIKLYASLKLNFRSGILYGIMWFVSMLSLIPSGICWGLAGYLWSIIPGCDNQVVLMFSALQLCIIGFFLLGLYLKCVSTIVLSPFLFIKNPDMNPFRILNKSRKMIYGKKLECLKLMLLYIPGMLPVVTIPFVLPKAVMAVTVFACDIIGDESWDN